MSGTQNRENHVERTNGMQSRMATLLAYLVVAVSPSQIDMGRLLRLGGRVTF
jgi:hypothetical protein